ncbi:MAG: hypothetical protein ACYCYM_11285 [Saccharofermentanales bacterium]
MLVWVKDRLDRIDELYPADRINASKERFRRVWNGEKPEGRYPFTYGQLTFDYYDDVHTPEERLRHTLDEIIVHGALSDDYIPSLFPGCRQSTIPSMFGAEEIRIGKDYTCEKIIHGYEDIDRLPAPSVRRGTVAYEWLEMQRYMLEATDGRIPVHVTDMQGPMDVAGQLWGYENLFLCAYDEPAYYRKLLSRLTEAFLLFWNSQKELLGDLFVPTHLFGWNWVPENIGGSISSDSIVMVSPDFFDEFYKPSIEEIGGVLGDISLHSCGDFSKVFHNLVDIPCLKAINAGQMTIEQLVHAGLDNATVAIAQSDISSAEKMFELMHAKSLRVDLSVIGLFPKINGRIVQYHEMSPEMRRAVKETDERIAEYAAH